MSSWLSKFKIVFRCRMLLIQNHYLLISVFGFRVGPVHSHLAGLLSIVHPSGPNSRLFLDNFKMVRIPVHNLAYQVTCQV